MMSRWRPPSAKSSPYISLEGFQKIKEELNHLWKIERPVITQAVHEAAKNGDRSENGDYIYNKQRLRDIDRRVRYLSKRLDELLVVDRLPSDQSRVFFGAWVTLELTSGSTKRIRIVGYDEIDTAQYWISIDSPLARALLNKQRDDEVKFSTPNGEETAWIIAIDYSDAKPTEDRR